MAKGLSHFPHVTTTGPGPMPNPQALEREIGIPKRSLVPRPENTTLACGLSEEIPAPMCVPSI